MAATETLIGFGLETFLQLVGFEVWARHHYMEDNGPVGCKDSSKGSKPRARGLDSIDTWRSTGSEKWNCRIAGSSGPNYSPEAEACELGWESNCVFKLCVCVCSG